MGAGEELCNFFALRIIMVRQKPKRKWPPTTGGKKASPRQSSRLFLAVLYSGEPVVPSSVSVCVQKWCTFHSFPFKVPPPPHKRLIYIGYGKEKGAGRFHYLRPIPNRLLIEQVGVVDMRIYHIPPFSQPLFSSLLFSSPILLCVFE